MRWQRWLRWLWRVLLVILFLSLLLIGILYLWHFVITRAPVTATEIIRPDEAQQAQLAVAGFQQLLEEYRTEYVARGAHAKAHACVKAEFSVHENLEENLQHGVFAEPGRVYQAWVRFSNGRFDRSKSQDYQKDARGLAIKLLSPPGVPLQVAAGQPPAQDFLLTDSPVFFARDITAYNDLIAAPKDFIGYFFPQRWNPFSWRVREFQAAKKIFGATPKSLLKLQYNSILPYKLGTEHNVKYGVRSCDPAKDGELLQDIAAEDYLREQLQEVLNQEDACLTFMVQKQDINHYMPLEDATVEWRESDSAFLPVATLTILQQSFTLPERDEFCENVAFAPWHALAEHRPLGQFNRMRRFTYPGSARYRQEKNHPVPLSGLDWEEGRVVH